MSVIPAQTITEVLQQLDIIIYDAKKNSSRLGYFPALYKRVTVEVKNKVEQKYFDDNARMEKLDVIFANRYLTAYQSYKNAGSCSAVCRSQVVARHVRIVESQRTSARTVRGLPGTPGAMCLC